MTIAKWIPVLIIFISFAGLRSSAQQCIQPVQCEWDSWDSGCLPLLPVIASNCNTVGIAVEQCTVRTYLCAAVPECPSCNKSGNSPIDLASGDTTISQSDAQAPGLGGGIGLSRTWNSVWPPLESAYREGIFGPNWRSTYEEQIHTGSDGYVKYSRSDGSFWSFGYSGTDGRNSIYKVASPANESATLTQNATNWTLVFQNGEQRVFDIVTGNLLSVSDRNGNTTQLTYDASHRLTTVVDPAGRHLYFTYAGPSSFLVTGVSSDIGLSISYAYDNQGRLTTVTKPDQTTTTLQYDSNSMITAVLDSNGKVLESHTYDSSNRGLTSARANGVEAVTVSYPTSGGFGE